MPQPSVIDQLSSEDRAWLEARLTEADFKRYRRITDELNARLQEGGCEVTVSKSALHRHGKELQRNIAAIKRSTEMAKVLAQEVGDDEGAMTSAVNRLIQQKFFDFMLDFDIDPEKVDPIKLTRAISDLNKGDIALRRFQKQARREAEERLAKLEADARRGSVDPEELIRRVREDIYGIYPQERQAG